MEELEIKTRQAINLKPNKYFTKTDFPYLYQKRGVLMMLRRPRMVLGDDVGLGKTVEAVIHFSYLLSADESTRALVFTEKIALKQWMAEFAKLTPSIRVRIVTAETHEDPAYRTAALRQFSEHVLITTYSTTYNYTPYLLEGMGSRFVGYADEPSYFKNTGTQLSRRMNEITVRACRFYGLTATVIENRLEEAYAIFRVVVPGLIPDLAYFYDNFCIREKIKRPRYLIRTVGYKNLKLFRDQIEPGFYGRLQTDPEVQQDLPEVISTDVPIILGKKQSEKLLEAMDKLLQMPAGDIQSLTVLSALIRAQQIANDPGLLGFDIPSVKTEALIEVLNGSLCGEKVLVHSKLRTQIDRLEDALKKAGINVTRITGAESTAQRDTNAEAFRSSKEVNVLLMTRAGLKGANLQAGSHFYWYDLPWSWGHYRQGIGRIKRTGSLHARVGSHRMLAELHPEVAAKVETEETIDHYTLQTIQRKAGLANVLSGDTDVLEATNSDILEVYEYIKRSYRKKAA